MDKYTANLGTKNLDISLYALSELPSSRYQQVHPDPVNSVSAGMQKLADRFVVTLLNQRGSTKHDSRFGTTLLQNMLLGSSLNFGAVQTAAAIAVSQAETQLRDDDASDVYTDNAGPDEKLYSAICTDVGYDPKDGIVRLYVSLTNEAGESYTYILPANLEVLA